MFTTDDTLQIMAYELQTMGMHLTILSNFINACPFLIIKNGMKLFETTKAEYTRYHAIHAQLTQADGKTDEEKVPDLLDFKKPREASGDYLLDLFKNILNKLSHQQIIHNLITLRDTITQFKTIFRHIYNKSTLDAVTIRDVDNYFTTKITHVQILNRLTVAIHALRKTSLKHFDRNQLEINGKLYKSLGKDDAKACLNIQYGLYALQESVEKFNFVQINLQPTVYPIDEYLSKENYTDIALYATLFKSEYVSDALRCHYNLMIIHHANIREKLIFLKRHLKGSFDTFFRLLRITHLYNDWRQTLIQQSAALLQKNAGLSKSIFIKRLLTSGKKTILKQSFEHQKASIIIQTLYSILKRELAKNKRKEDILSDLRKEKATLCRNIDQAEHQLTQKETNLQAILSTLILSVTDQPIYQLGYLTQSLGMHLSDKVPWLPILGEKLEEGFAEKWQHAQGMSFFVLSFLIANWFNYSYHFISSLNRFLFSQTNWLIKSGHYIDTAMQYTLIPCLNKLKEIVPDYMNNTFIWLKNFVRFDEIGLLEKERLLQWLSGLVINLITARENIVANIMGYTAATGCADGARRLVEYGCDGIGLDKKITHGISTFAHMAVYPYAYRFGFMTGHYIAPRKLYDDEITPANALKIFGLHGSPTKSNIQKRYHQLSKANHPDRCKLNKNCDTAEDRTIEINKAYSVLAKKNS